LICKDRVQIFREVYDKKRKDYAIGNKGEDPKTYSGKALQDGIPISLKKEEAVWMYIIPEGK
jgi:hypothetical protein